MRCAGAIQTQVGSVNQQALLNHPIGANQEGARDRKADGLRGLLVDDELEQGRQLDGQIGRLGALEDLSTYTAERLKVSRRLAP